MPQSKKSSIERGLLAGLTCFAILGGARMTSAADNVLSVQTLNEKKPWDQFVDPPVRLRVEGRMGSFGSSPTGASFRLTRCDVRFVVDKEKIRTINSKHTVEVKGYFKKISGKLEFEVDDVKVVPGYAEQFESRSSKLRRGTPEEWTELGDWIAGLSRFYSDADLMKKADNAYSKAIDVEYEGLKSSDAEGRFSLAKKISDFKLSERRRMELIHEGLNIQWQALRKAESPDLSAWQKFAISLADRLPGTDKRIENLPRDAKESYAQDPVSTYRKADDDLRPLLHRLFFIGVTRSQILQNVSSDGHDGDLIADQIEALIPEESSLAERHRLLSMAYRMANIGTASRADAENLAAAYRVRHQDEAAKLVLLQWVKSHELRLKGDGVIGLIQLADEYLTLLHNEPAAVEFLTDAYKIDPNFEDVKVKLTSLGYQWRSSRWMKSDPNKPQVTLSTSQPQSPGGIALGMTATDLRKLLGQPGSLARAITARGITEVWSFGPAGSSRLVVRLEKKGTDTEPKINAITNPR